MTDIPEFVSDGEIFLAALEVENLTETAKEKANLLCQQITEASNPTMSL